jgi:hypothetical protein
MGDQALQFDDLRVLRACGRAVANKRSQKVWMAHPGSTHRHRASLSRSLTAAP